MKDKNNVYQPAEDSYLLAEELSKIIKRIRNPQNIKLLDMGSGSGIQAETCIKAGIKRENILAIDINEKAIEILKSKGLKAINSNLFSNINKKERFNLIIFNPPYLPEDKHDKKRDTTGGKTGSETILRFLKQAKDHLTKNGRIITILSSLTNPKFIKRNAKDYRIKQLARKRLFFEELYVWLIELKKPKTKAPYSVP